MSKADTDEGNKSIRPRMFEKVHLKAVESSLLSLEKEELILVFVTMSQKVSSEEWKIPLKQPDP